MRTISRISVAPVRDDSNLSVERWWVTNVPDAAKQTPEPTRLSGSDLSPCMPPVHPWSILLMCRQGGANASCNLWLSGFLLIFRHFLICRHNSLFRTHATLMRASLSQADEARISGSSPSHYPAAATLALAG